ncbi:MAG: hypothetical protein HY903_09085, partial [Deltaproteobacteria bacterium]|nr:hypothetical protein [Deltaproteobacteria bacterium]
YLTYLQVRNNAAVVAGAGSQVRLFVAGDVVMENNSDVNFPPAMGASVAIYASVSATAGGILTVQNNNESALTIYAPAADIVVRNNGKIYGTITGRNVSVQNNGNLHRIGAEQPDPSPRCQGFGRP